MGLDIRVSRAERRYCPNCGEELPSEIVSTESSGGIVWYDWLEMIGYYVPYNRRTEENDWYGKDMTLTDEQMRELYNYIGLNAPYNGDAIAGLIARAVVEDNQIIINADW